MPNCDSFIDYVPIYTIQGKRLSDIFNLYSSKLQTPSNLGIPIYYFFRQTIAAISHLKPSLLFVLVQRRRR